ncbi:MAG: (Fe-S)-binding protein [Desulfuromonas sp.]|nr:MAG: (Fe-S)-binding protein [Desulfuromonas sp.]
MSQPDPTSDLETLRNHIASTCIHCGRCERECAFLQRYGDPGHLAQKTQTNDPGHDHIPFSCSLCGLCSEVCPRDLEMAKMFLAMRRDIVDQGRGRYPGHRGLLNYERLGTSRWLSGSFLPPACETIYFPGCALTGSRPGITRRLITHLQRQIPNLGVVLNCCGKPSHDLGRQPEFANHFIPLKNELLQRGIRRVLVNCPNCHAVFRRYGAPLEVRTVYESLAAQPLPEATRLSGTVVVHDPCVMRHNQATQSAVRQLLDNLGEWIDPVKHSGRLTRCCGEGGAVHGVNPRLAESWAKRHAKEAHGEQLVTYCAGCAQHLDRHTPTSHILDLIFAPSTALGGIKTVKAPFSYLQRWLLKRYLRRHYRRNTL